MFPKKLLPLGSEAPDFNLLDHHGQLIRSSEIVRPERMLLVFYTSNNGRTCARQLGAMRDQFAAFRQRDLVILGVNPGDWEKQHAFATKQNLPFSLLYDAYGKVAKRYHAAGLVSGYTNTRTVYGIDWNRKICFAKRGEPTLSEIFQAFDKRT